MFAEFFFDAAGLISTIFDKKKFAARRRRKRGVLCKKSFTTDGKNCLLPSLPNRILSN